MITEKWRSPFLLTFLILVLSERFANGFLELCKPPGRESSLENVDTSEEIPGVSRNTSRVMTLEESHKNIRITMQLFKVMKDVIERNLDHINMDEVDDAHVYPQHWRVKLCVDREVKTILDKLKGEEAVDDRYRLKAAGTLTAVLMIKFMAFMQSMEFTRYAAELPASSTEEALRQENVTFLNGFLTHFALRINTRKLIDTIINLVEGAVSIERKEDPTADTFRHLFWFMNSIDTAHRNVLESIQSKQGYVTVSQRHTKGLHRNLINMLNEFNSIPYEEAEQEGFLKRKQAVYSTLVDNDDFYKDIQKSDEVYNVLKIMKNIEIKIAEEFGLFGDINDKEKEELNRETNSSLLIGRMANNYVVLNLDQ